MPLLLRATATTRQCTVTHELLCVLQVKEMVIATMGSMAIAAGAAYEPYFDAVVAGLLPLTELAEPECIRIRSKCVRGLDGACVLSCSYVAVTTAAQSLRAGQRRRWVM